MPFFHHRPIDLVIDVRSRLEFWTGHLDGATCIPVTKLESVIAQRDIAKDARILVYCASGARSAAAARMLTSLGYRNVKDGGAMAVVRPNYVG
jgi:phage shock protein E